MKSFYDWCIENNKKEFWDSWDYEENCVSPKDIPYSCHEKYIFKCQICETKRQYLINSITNMGIVLKCPYCNSFEKWCVENCRKDILERWDYELNSNAPSDYSKGSKKYIYLKCQNKVHKSDKYMIKNITHNLVRCECRYCNSFAQWGIDNIGVNFLDEYWDYEKNVLNPWDIGAFSHKTIYLKCAETDYHRTYETKPCDVTAFGNNIKCPYCGNTRVNKYDSIGYLYPDIFDIWSDKNIKTPYECKTKSRQKVWLRCKNNIHPDSLRTLDNAFSNNYECPYCVNERTESKIEEKVRRYINNELHLETLHEHRCNILPLNPKTNRPLPFDNEVVKYKLIIEVMGIQHYQITNFANLAAKAYGTTPEYEFEYLRWKDGYKKKFAISNGYYYLSIPYWCCDNDSYKKLIMDKIYEIENAA